MEILGKIGLRKKKMTNEYSVDKNYHEVFKYAFMPTLDEKTDEFMIMFSTASLTM